MPTHRPARFSRAPRRRTPRPKRALSSEVLESRCLLAGQTTGLFLHDAGTADGYVLFSPNTTNTTYLMDKDANIVNTWTSSYGPGLLGYLQPDGSLIRAANLHPNSNNGAIVAAGGGGRIEQFDWDGNLIWEFTYDAAGPTFADVHWQHHDIEIMPNGNILLIAWEYKTETEATAAGRDPNLPGPGFLYPDTIVEVQPDLMGGGGTVVWKWNIWDHLVQDFDNTKANYATDVADHPELIDVNYVSSGTGAGASEDWTHANGIDYNPELDQIVLSVREFSEFWIIDHSTTTAEAEGHTGGNSGKGGDLLYRWGNPQAYGRGDASDRQLFYQHDPKWILDGLPGAGNITVFNNGWGGPADPDVSSSVEIVTPVDAMGDYPALDPGEAHGPAAPVWSHSGPADKFSPIISGTQRLPNGNTMLTYGVNGTFSEVTPAGVEVWKYVNPYTSAGTLGMMDEIPSLGIPIPGLDALLTNFVFKTVHYDLNYSTEFPASVAGRHLFYNQSAFDGDSAALGAADDGAIATDKTAYLPGSGIANFEAVSSYSRGINGIMIDLLGGGDHAAITTADFVFKIGNNNSPDTWTAAPAPSSITVRSGAGASGADRVEIAWATGDIRNRWLEVQVLANDNTGLTAPDVHFWGSRVGDSGTSTPATVFQTTSADAAQVFGNLSGSAAVDNLRDYNRSGTVTGADGAQVFGNLGAIVRIDIGGGGPFAPEGDGGAAAAIASALAIEEGSGAQQVAARVEVPPVEESRRAPLGQASLQLIDAPDERALAIAATPDWLIEVHDADEDLD